ncbi:hypothetical protein [Ideonella paludis]
MSWRERVGAFKVWRMWRSRWGLAWVAASLSLGLLVGHVGRGPEALPSSPLLLLDGRTYVVVSHRESSASDQPALLLREERTGRLEWRRAIILIALADGVSLLDVLTDVPVASFVSRGPHQYQLTVAPTHFSKAHRALLTDWRVLRAEVPLLQHVQPPSLISGPSRRAPEDVVLKKS